MYDGQMVFAQLMAFIPRRPFDTCVQRYQGDRRVRRFNCRDQFLCMAFAQLTYRESLRDIETCLRAMGTKLYHAGFRLRGGGVSRSTLADANEHRDWRIWADLAAVLIAHARRLCANDVMDVTLKQTVYAFDSTTIDLCLALFPWASFRRRKGAVKLHTLIDLRGNIPCFLRVTPGNVHDVNALDHLPIEPGAYYVMDRGYVDFTRLHLACLGKLDPVCVRVSTGRWPRRFSCQARSVFVTVRSRLWKSCRRPIGCSTRGSRSGTCCSRWA